MSISQLPPEILSLIFRSLDGRSFCVAKQVNRSWQSIIMKMQRNQKLWRYFCLKEIEQGLLEEFFSFKNIPLQDIILDWFAVYRRWFQGHLISEKCYSLQEVPAFDENPVTCVKTSGSWVITGHRNGYICIWNHTDGKLWEKNLCHLKAVTDIALVDLLNLGSYHGLADYHWSHHHMISVSLDTCIRVTSLLEPFSESDTSSNSGVQNFHKHGDTLTCIRVFGNQFVAASKDNTVTLWEIEVLKEPHFRLNVTFLRSIIGPADIIRTLGFWNNQIYCISHAHKVSLCEKNDWIEQSHLKYHPEEKRITSVYTFRDQIVIAFTSSGKMCISLREGKYKTYAPFQELQTFVVSVMLNGSTLALGGENGKLYLYHVPCSESLLQLNLSQPEFQERLCAASIVAIDILYEYNTPVVVAATNANLFCIKWFKKKRKLQTS